MKDGICVEIVTDGRTITETDIVMFSYFTGDWTYLHTDAEASKVSIFGERVAHGYLTLSISLGLVVRSGAIDVKKFIALISIESVKFLNPVKIGDTLKVAYTITKEDDRGNRVKVTTKARTINQKNQTVMEFKTVHLERTEGEGGKL
ncbi:MAG: MaoC/PaaZ C-terminal domain-containing protein [Thermoplasmatales archaeon]|nr:MaoC/PaaZ C-terminal domain-containing protein [Thermoplasmatales archaeon]